MPNRLPLPFFQALWRAGGEAILALRHYSFVGFLGLTTETYFMLWEDSNASYQEGRIFLAGQSSQTI